jgi:hypothetical protein
MTIPLVVEIEEFDDYNGNMQRIGEKLVPNISSKTQESIEDW